MALLRGKLFAGALFAGALLGSASELVTQPVEHEHSGGGMPARQFFPSYPEKPVLQANLLLPNNPNEHAESAASFQQSLETLSLADQIALNIPGIPLPFKRDAKQYRELLADKEVSDEAMRQAELLQQAEEAKKILAQQEELAIALLMLS